MAIVGIKGLSRSHLTKRERERWDLLPSGSAAFWSWSECSECWSWSWSSWSDRWSRWSVSPAIPSITSICTQVPTDPLAQMEYNHKKGQVPVRKSQLTSLLKHQRYLHRTCTRLTNYLTYILDLICSLPRQETSPLNSRKNTVRSSKKTCLV